MTCSNVSTVRMADSAGISAAAEILRGGGLAAFPTETVYGLGADATNGKAVAGIFAAKGRPRFNPLIVHVKDESQAAEFASFSALASALAHAFWPGPLTLVLPRRANCRLSLLVSAGLNTVALRAPGNKIAQELIEKTGVPIAAPSANTSGKISPTTAAHVAADLGDRAGIILDGGKTEIGIESTIIGFTADKPVLLRPGGLAREAIERIAGPLAVPQSGVISSPGQMASHYAPHAALRLNAARPEPEEALLAFGPDVPPTDNLVLNLSPAGDPVEAAANLFAMLHALDDAGMTRAAVMPIPDAGLGEAINDRLKRAAAPRPSGN
jgi:L-threonylcarbamoyladenylate synthase